MSFFYLNVKQAHSTDSIILSFTYIYLPSPHDQQIKKSKDWQDICSHPVRGDYHLLREGTSSRSWDLL